VPCYCQVRTLQAGHGSDRRLQKFREFSAAYDNVIDAVAPASIRESRRGERK
jgi:hypothetical protein